MGLGMRLRGFEIGVLVSGFWVLGSRVFEIWVWVSGFGNLDCSDLVFWFSILCFSLSGLAAGASEDQQRTRNDFNQNSLDIQSYVTP